MVKCNFCEETVAMPYRCSLCEARHCGSHRLPEQHECMNIDTFKSPSYAQSRIKKTGEIQQISSENQYEGGMTMVQMDHPMFDNLWEGKSQNQTILLAGLLLGFISGLEIFTNLGFNPSGYTYLGSNILFTSIGFFTLYLFRIQKAHDLGFHTKFLFWPIGVAIALLLSLFSLVFHLFGFYINEGGSHRDEAELAKYTTYTFAGLFISVQLFYFFFSTLFNGILPDEILTSLSISSVDILWFGVLIMIPFGIFDGAKLFYFNRRSYFKHMGLLVILAITTFF